MGDFSVKKGDVRDQSQVTDPYGQKLVRLRLDPRHIVGGRLPGGVRQQLRDYRDLDLPDLGKALRVVLHYGSPMDLSLVLKILGDVEFSLEEQILRDVQEILVKNLGLAIHPKKFPDTRVLTGEQQKRLAENAWFGRMRSFVEWKFSRDDIPGARRVVEQISGISPLLALETLFAVYESSSRERELIDDGLLNQEFAALIRKIRQDFPGTQLPADLLDYFKGKIDPESSGSWPLIQTGIKALVGDEVYDQMMNSLAPHEQTRIMLSPGNLSSSMSSRSMMPAVLPFSPHRAQRIQTARTAAVEKIHYNSQTGQFQWQVEGADRTLPRNSRGTKSGPQAGSAMMSLAVPLAATMVDKDVPFEWLANHPKEARARMDELMQAMRWLMEQFSTLSPEVACLTILGGVLGGSALIILNPWKLKADRAVLDDDPMDSQKLIGAIRRIGWLGNLARDRDHLARWLKDSDPQVIRQAEKALERRRIAREDLMTAYIDAIESGYKVAVTNAIERLMENRSLLSPDQIIRTSTLLKKKLRQPVFEEWSRPLFMKWTKAVASSAEDSSVEMESLPGSEGADNAALPTAQNGGIDMNAIGIDRQGESGRINDGEGILFEMQGVQDLLNMDIQGFAPVMIDMTPLNSVLPLLGLAPDTDKAVKFGQEELEQDVGLVSS